MSRRLARALLVMAVFAAAAVLSATSLYLSTAYSTALPPPPAAAKAKPFGGLFLSAFRYYLAWAIVTPGILWLGRRVPFSRDRWAWPLAFHVTVPLLAAGPFFVFTVSLGMLIGQGLPPYALLASMWWRLVPLVSAVFLPVYWIILGAGAAVRVHRETRAEELQALELQRSLAAAQLDALRMKLQPHFLFNTLNSISCLAQEDDTDAVGQVVERLGTLLRLSMETSGRQFVTLAEELSVLDEYLAIEEIRFRDRLRVERRLDPAALGALVPNLILQPLVENAVEHGFSGRMDASLLEISAHREDGRLEVEVRDDGPGLPPGWSVVSGAGRGLRNVVERLEALYGEAGRLDVENTPAGGAVARLRLPFSETAPRMAGG